MTSEVTFLGEGVPVGFIDGGDGIVQDFDGTLTGIAGTGRRI